MQLIIGALKLAEFPDHISIDYVSTKYIKNPVSSRSTFYKVYKNTKSLMYSN